MEADFRLNLWSLLSGTQTDEKSDDLGYFMNKGMTCLQDQLVTGTE